MFAEGPRNSAPASLPKSMVPRPSDDSPLRVHTTKIVDPGRYSHRSTAFPRSERNVKSCGEMTNPAAGPAPSGSIESPPATGVEVPPSVPHTRFLTPRPPYHWSAARQAVVEDARPMNPEALDVPVIEWLDVAEQLQLPVRQVAVEVVLLLRAGDEKELAVPLGRLDPLREDVAAHVPV